MEHTVTPRKKSALWRGILAFALGCACFIVSQPLTRLPLLQAVQGSVAVTVFTQTNMVLFLALVALSAGVFEEGFRFLFKRIALRPAEAPFSQPLLFGLGHGLTEAALVLVPAFLQGYTLGDLWLGILERVLAVAFHVAMTVVVWNGFQTGKRLRFLLIAVLLHAVADFFLPLLSLSHVSPLLIEGLFLIFTIPCAVYAARSKKHYLIGGNDHAQA